MHGINFTMQQKNNFILKNLGINKKWFGLLILYIRDLNVIRTHTELIC